MWERPSKVGSWTPSALTVLQAKYLIKDSSGVAIETPEDLCWRVACAIAQAELEFVGEEEANKVAEDIYNAIVDHKFIFNTPTLINAGRDTRMGLAACYAFRIPDSMEGIFDRLKDMALVQKTGGGTGFNFSYLRAKGARVASSGGESTGPIGFMQIFDKASEEVKQGGVRRGANMGLLRVDHPDIVDFIKCKDDGGLTNFNISVLASDAFMKKATGEDPNGMMELIDHKGKPVGMISAPDLLQQIAAHAWATGDPGMMFGDAMERGNTLRKIDRLDCVNPCGEQMLLDGEACNLGAINLSEFWVDSKGLDEEGLAETAKKAVRWLDNVISICNYPTPEIDQKVRRSRKVGLGIMNLSTLLIKAGLGYDTQEGRELAQRAMAIIQRAAHESSRELAEVRGCFPAWKQSDFAEQGVKMRNATVTTIAPNGATSLILGADSGGVEPLFAVAYVRKTVDGPVFRFINPLFEEVAKREGFWSEALMHEVAEKGTVKDVLGVPEKWRKVFVTAHDIHWRDHVAMQAALQKYVDNGISKTINCPHDATVEEIREAYVEAWRAGCKGITVFRDGCKAGVLSVGTEKKAEAAPEPEAKPLDPATMSREELEDFFAEAKEGLLGEYVLAPFGKVHPVDVLPNMPARKLQARLGTSTMSVFITEMNGRPFEVYVSMGHSGSDVSASCEAIGRLISEALRCGLDPWRIVKQLRGIGGSLMEGFGANRVRSLPDAVGKLLGDYLRSLEEGEDAAHVEPEEEMPNPLDAIEHQGGNGHIDEVAADLCPSCGSFTVRAEGCVRCPQCGWSAC